MLRKSVSSRRKLSTYVDSSSDSFLGLPRAPSLCPTPPSSFVHPTWSNIAHTLYWVFPLPGTGSPHILILAPPSLPTVLSSHHLLCGYPLIPGCGPVCAPCSIHTHTDFLASRSSWAFPFQHASSRALWVWWDWLAILLPMPKAMPGVWGWLSGYLAMNVEWIRWARIYHNIILNANTQQGRKEGEEATFLSYGSSVGSSVGIVLKVRFCQLAASLFSLVPHSQWRNWG